MTQVASVRVSIVVALDRHRAFAAFTEDIGDWYRIDPFTVSDHRRVVTIRFEPRVGGRLLEVQDAATGEGREMGRVTVWEPGRALVYRDGRDTEVDVRFDDSEGGTRVTVEQRGLGQLPPDVADHVARFGAPRTLLPWFEAYVRARRAP